MEVVLDFAPRASGLLPQSSSDPCGPLLDLPFALRVFGLKAMAPHSSTLPGKSHGWRSLVGCSPGGR